MCGFVRNVTDKRGVNPETRRKFVDSREEWFSFTDVGKICFVFYLFLFLIFIFIFVSSLIVLQYSFLFFLSDMESVSPTLSQITVDLPKSPSNLPPVSPTPSPEYSPFLSAKSFDISHPMKVVKSNLMEKALLLGSFLLKSPYFILFLS